MSPSNDTPAKQLATYIHKFTPEIASLAKAILAKMRTRYPTALELVYDNYNALAIGFGPTERPSEAIFPSPSSPAGSISSSCKPKDCPTRKRNCNAVATSRSTSASNPQPHWTSPQSKN